MSTWAESGPYSETSTKAAYFNGVRSNDGRLGASRDGLGPRRITAPRIGWRWIQVGLAGLAVAGGLGEGVVKFEDDALGAVFNETILVLAADDGEGVEDVGGVAAVHSVEKHARRKRSMKVIPQFRGLLRYRRTDMGTR